jgi:hypothetical protein
MQALFSSPPDRSPGDTRVVVTTVKSVTAVERKSGQTKLDMSILKTVGLLIIIDA